MHNLVIALAFIGLLIAPAIFAADPATAVLAEEETLAPQRRTKTLQSPDPRGWFRDEVKFIKALQPRKR